MLMLVVAEVVLVVLVKQEHLIMEVMEVLVIQKEILFIIGLPVRELLHFLLLSKMVHQILHTLEAVVVVLKIRALIVQLLMVVVLESLQETEQQALAVAAVVKMVLLERQVLVVQE
jgi:hypothetical protein